MLSVYRSRQSTMANRVNLFDSILKRCVGKEQRDVCVLNTIETVFYSHIDNIFE